MTRKPETLVSAERVRTLLDYNANTGLLTWRVRRGGKANADTPATAMSSEGYFRIGIDGVRYAVHRVIWLHVHGEWPAGQVDHVNGIRTDNRLVNLRVVTHQQNTWNQRRPQQGNPALGVYRTKSGKFQSLITVGGRRLYLGLYCTAAEASAAYQAAKLVHHAIDTNINKRFDAQPKLKRHEMPCVPQEGEKT